MNKIIIRGEVASLYQHIYVYKNGERVDYIGVQFNDLAETVISCLEKYKLNQVTLSGSRFYMEGVEEEIKKANMTKYNNLEISFKYV